MFRPDLTKIALLVPLALAAIWLPLRSGGEDRGALLFVQFTCFVALAWLSVKRPALIASALKQRLVQLVMAGAAVAALATVFSLDLEVSFPLVIMWLWLAALAVLIVGAVGHGVPASWLCGMLVMALVLQVSWSFFVWWGGGEAASVQSGTFFAPNQYAGYVLLLAPLLLAVTLTRRPPREALAWGFMTCLAYLGLWFSGSRAGLVAAALGAAFVILRRGPVPAVARGLRVASLGVGILALFWVLTSPLVMQTTEPSTASPLGISGKEGTGASSLQMRAQWARGALRIFGRSPALGSGPGTYGDMLVAVMDPEWHWSRYAHNDYLEGLAESGPLMMAVLLALPGYALLTFLRSGSGDPWLAGLAGGVIGAAAHGLMDHDWSFAAWAATYILVLSLLSYRTVDEKPVRRPIRLASTAAAALAALIVLAAAGGDRVKDRGLNGARTAAKLQPYATAPLLIQDALLSRSSSETAARERILRRASELDGLDPFILWRLAEVQSKAGRSDDASESYNRAIRLSLNSPTGYRLAAQFELNRNEPGRAAGILDAGISRLNRRPTRERLAGEIARLFILRSEAELELTGPAAALGYAGAATRTAPGRLEGWEQVVELACAANDPEAALAAIDRATATLRADQIQQLRSKFQLSCEVPS